MKLALVALVIAAGCGKTTAAKPRESAATSVEPARVSATPDAAAAPATAPVETARIVRTTPADRGHLAAVIAREQQAGRKPLLAVISASCPNCAAVEKWFTGPPFGQVALIEVDGVAFKSELAALHVSDSAICLYTLDRGRWTGDLCAMTTGTIGTAVGEAILDQVKSHLP